MSTFFLGQEEEAQAFEDAALSGTPRDARPTRDRGGPFEGLGEDPLGAVNEGMAGFTAGVRGVVRFPGELGRTGEYVTGLDLGAPDEAPGLDRNAFDRQTREDIEHLRASARELTPDPATRSEAANLIGGVARTLTTAGIGGLLGGPFGVVTGPATLGAGTGLAEYDRLIESGVDPETARNAAWITGGFMTAMGAAPVAVPGKIWARAASGAGLNVGFGAGQRASMDAYLRGQGYDGSVAGKPNVADRYNWLDPQAMAVDATLGAFFGGFFGGRGTPRTRAETAAGVEPPPTISLTPDQWLDRAREFGNDEDFTEAYAHALIAKDMGAAEADGVLALLEEDADAATLSAGRARASEISQNLVAQAADPDLGAAALVEADAIHRDIQSAPGIPADSQAARIHSNAMRRVEEQAANDEPINAEGMGVEDARFIPHPETVEFDPELREGVESLAQALDEAGFAEQAAEIRAAREAGMAPPDDDGLMFSRAFHGTPHDFDRFDISRMGTGEGAQAFGWGLYFAGARKAGEHYRDVLSRRYNAGGDVVRYWLDRADGDRERAAASFSRYAQETGLSQDVIDETLANIRADRGRLYEVELPDGPYVDFDNPFGEQSPEVQRALAALYGMRVRDIPPDAQARVVGKEEAQRMRAMGIVGIRYLDALSRSEGDGTSNFVIFDDKDVQIVAKDGQPVTPEERGELMFSRGEPKAERFYDERLSPLQNKAVEMQRNGFSIAEIADELDTTQDGVSGLLWRARRKGIDVERGRAGPPGNMSEAVERMMPLRDADGKPLSSEVMAARLRAMGFEKASAGGVRALRSYIKRTRGEKITDDVPEQTGTDGDLKFSRAGGAQRINLPQPYVGAADVIIDPGPRDIGRILAEQRQLRQEQTVRWGLTEDGRLFVWDGNTAIHGGVAEGAGEAFVKIGEINDGLEIEPTLRAARRQRTLQLSRGGGYIDRNDPRRDPLYEQAYARAQEAVAAHAARTDSEAGRDGGRDGGTGAPGQATGRGIGPGLGHLARAIRDASGIRIRKVEGLTNDFFVEIDPAFELPADLAKIIEGRGAEEGNQTRIEFERVTDGPYPGFRIKWSKVDPKIKGERVGGWLYRQFVDWAHRQGETLYSDNSLSPDSWDIYEMLRRRGYGVDLIAQDVIVGADGQRKSRSNTPIFRVRPRAEEPIEIEPGAQPPVGDYQIDGPPLRTRFGESFSRGNVRSGASPEAITRALINEFGADAQSLLDSAKTEIAGTTGDLARITGRPIPADAKGAYDPRTGKSYIVADNVSPQEAARILLHEVGVHTGMRGMLGTKLYAQLGREVEALVEAGNPVAAEARKRVEALVKSGDMKAADAPEETIAYLVETAPDLPFVRRLLAQIRQWLWRTFKGATWIGRLTVEDIRQLAITSLRRESRTKARGTTDGPLMFEGSGRELDQQGFVSISLEAAKALPTRAMRGEEAINRILKARGVEGMTGRVSDELDFLGLREEFGSKKSVTKEEIIDYIRANRLALDVALNRFDPRAQQKPPTQDMLRRWRRDLRAAGIRTEAEQAPYIQRWTGRYTNSLQDAGIRRGPGDLRLPGDEPVFELRLKIPPFLGMKADEVIALTTPDEARAVIDANHDLATDRVARSWNVDADEIHIHSGGYIAVRGKPIDDDTLLVIARHVADQPEALDPSGRRRLPGSDFESHWSRPPSNDLGVLVSVRGEERVDDKGQRTLFGGEVQSDLAQQLRGKKDALVTLLADLLRQERGALLSLESARQETGPHRDRYIRDAEARIQSLKDDRERYNRAIAELQATPLASKTSQWTGAAVRAMVMWAAREGFDSVSFPTAKTSERIQGNSSAGQHYETNVKGAAQKVARVFGAELRLGSVKFGMADNSFSPAYFLEITPSMRSRIVKEGLPLFSRSFDELEKMLGDTRIRTLKEPPANAPEIGTPEWDAALAGAKAKPSNELTPMDRFILAASKEPQAPLVQAMRRAKALVDEVADENIVDQTRQLVERVGEIKRAYDEFVRNETDNMRRAALSEVAASIDNMAEDAQGVARRIETLTDPKKQKQNFELLAQSVRQAWRLGKFEERAAPEDDGAKFSIGKRDNDPVKQAIADEPDLTIPGPLGSDTKAADALAAADNAIKVAREMQKGFRAAASCAAQHGIDATARAFTTIAAGHGLGGALAIPAAYGVSMAATADERQRRSPEYRREQGRAAVRGLTNDERFPVVESAGPAYFTEGSRLPEDIEEQIGYDVNPATGAPLHAPADAPNVGGPEEYDE